VRIFYGNSDFAIKTSEHHMEGDGQYRDNNIAAAAKNRAEIQRMAMNTDSVEGSAL